MAKLVDGKQTANQIISAIIERTAQLKANQGITPGLAVVLVGDDPASKVYVASKGKVAKRCGFHSEQKNLPSNTTEEELIRVIEQLNADPTIHGILLQLPLPKPLNSKKIIQHIQPEKDVDGLNFINIGKMTVAHKTGFVPCTPAGIMLLLLRYIGANLAGKHAVVIGRSDLVGKPVAQLLLQKDATVTIAHSKTPNLPELCKQADILIAAVGQANLVKAEWVKEGATIIDVGINRVTHTADNNNKANNNLTTTNNQCNQNNTSDLVGDVDFQQVAPYAGFITPVPGGVGPMTIAMLMANSLNAALLANKLPAFDLQEIVTSIPADNKEIA